MHDDPTHINTDFAARALSGARVVVTRSADRADVLTRPLAALGAEVIQMPATRVELLDPAPVLDALRNLGHYQWLVFTSQNAVTIFWQLLRDAGVEATALDGLRVAAVGPATAGALRELGIRVAVTPRRFVAEGLLEAFRARDDVQGSRVLYLVARGAREVLPAGLRELGALVDVKPLYRSVPDAEGGSALRERLLRGEVDLITFTAGSSARAFVDAVGVDAAARAGLVSIGPATSAAIRALGLDVRAEAAPSTIEELVLATVAAWR
jgi:uroporphyrinogen-III synthase